MFTGATRSFDQWLLLDFPRPPALDFAAHAITFLGSNPFTIGLAILAALVAFRRAGRFALFPPVAVLCGLFSENLLKEIFHRPRPELIPHGMAASGWSYPSGHALMSAVTWFSLAWLLSTLNRSSRIAAFSVATLLTILIGLTRLYFAVHWPTDILGGWIAGLLLWSFLPPACEPNSQPEPAA